MTSIDHLLQLVELRDALLREVTRLNVMIANEKVQRRAANEPGRIWVCDSLSWEDALHRAKMPQSHEGAGMAHMGSASSTRLQPMA